MLLACGSGSAAAPQADGQHRKTIAEERKIPARTAELAPLKRTAENGDADAQVKYGKYLHQEFNDPIEGFRRMERAAAQNHPEGLYILSLYYLNGWSGVKSPGLAFKLMQASAEAGHAWGQVDLGLYYVKGTGTPKDFAKAKEWFSKAADTGLPIAQYEMGVL